MATLAEILLWFMTGKKPTQAQFWVTLSSFYHKLEKIPVSAIEGLTNILNSKAEKSQFDAHKTAEDAHKSLFDLKADAQALLNHIQATFDAIGLEAQTRANNDDSLQFQIDDSKDLIFQAQEQINGINLLLTSNDINLDTVQEIVDAIKTVQTSLATILVDDFTTGGVTKALTAEMGKTLKGLVDGLTTNKVDKVAGERLINAAEITKLAAVTNVTTTVKTITSASLATQDVAGFVAYINALAVVLVVSANEIVEYQLSDTGRIFKLLLRGRSFGVGQPAIVAADVEEVTLWLAKDLKLSNYPSTRNDGALSTNKVLSPDANGNLKLYTMAVMPAPYLEDLIPDSHLPSTTGNFILKGSFFTPSMTVVVQGQTLNYKTFISDNEVRVNLTTGATPGNFDVTLDNGVEVVFQDVLLITSGTIFKPALADWTSVISPLNISDEGEAKIGIWGSWTSAVWSKEFDKTKDFRLQFKFQKSPLGDPFFNGESGSAHVQLLYADNSDTTVLATVSNNTGASLIRFMGLPMYGRVASWDWGSFLDVSGPGSANWLTVHNNTFEFRYISGILYAYTNGNLAFRYDIVFAQNVKLKVNLKSFDVVGIKYIEF